MIDANLRSARAALDAARPVVSRLDISRHPEDVAADVIDGWSAVETALRALLGGSALGGQQLVRELRQRELLSLDQAHAILEFQAARDRVGRTDYRPTSADIGAAREGFRQAEDRIEQPAGQASPSAYPRPAQQTTAAPMPDDLPARPTRRTAGIPRAAMFGVLGVLALVLAGLAWASFSRGGGGGNALQQATADFAAGRRDAARAGFAQAARDDPKLALPHVYLGRIARESNDFNTARAELTQAITLEPSNAVAQREMGSYLLAAGNADLARSFYVRALKLDPRDNSAQGFLGCALARLGRLSEAQPFLTRAGNGPWTNCSQQPPPAPYPVGAVPPA